MNIQEKEVKVVNPSQSENNIVPKPEEKVKPLEIWQRFLSVNQVDQM